jgi:hypothetical protein
MRRLHVSRPSPAMVVAIIALIVALGGSAYAAGKIGSHQLKKNAVSTKKIKDGAVTGAKIANNAITGGKLAAGAVGTVMRQGPTTSIPGGSAKSAEVNCKSGERATGGGVYNESNVGALHVTSSYPLPNPGTPPATGDGQTPTGWRVWIQNTFPSGAGNERDVNAYVICTK